MKPAITVENLGKQYQLGTAATAGRSWSRRLADAAREPWRRLRQLRGQSRPDEQFWALRDVSFDIYPGEVVGFVGRNGAGKSTLLKILARITSPTTGRAVLHGRVGSLLEVGTGFHPELTGRENVFLNGAILGMTRAEVRRKFDDIVAFAEVERFLDTPVKRYSSGMYVRLAFAVAAHLDPEILLVDEVLAVGDAQFQTRCLDQMRRVATSGRTVLFVSHNMTAIQSLCHSCLLLRDGRLVTRGPTRTVVEQYLGELFAAARSRALAQRTDRSGTGLVRICGFHLEDATGRPIGAVRSGQDCTFVFEYECRRGPCGAVSLAFGVLDSGGAFLFRNYTADTGQDFAHVSGHGQFRCRVPRLPLRAGRYLLGFRATADGAEADYIAGNAAEFLVEAGDFYGTGRQSDHAPILVDHEWSLAPASLESVHV